METELLTTGHQVTIWPELPVLSWDCQTKQAITQTDQVTVHCNTEMDLQGQNQAGSEGTRSITNEWPRSHVTHQRFPNSPAAPSQTSRRVIYNVLKEEELAQTHAIDSLTWHVQVVLKRTTVTRQPHWAVILKVVRDRSSLGQCSWPSILHRAIRDGGKEMRILRGNRDWLSSQLANTGLGAKSSLMYKKVLLESSYTIHFHPVLVHLSYSVELSAWAETMCMACKVYNIILSGPFQKRLAGS